MFAAGAWPPQPRTRYRPPINKESPSAKSSCKALRMRLAHRHSQIPAALPWQVPLPCQVGLGGPSKPGSP
eukprot:scaffold100_cov357-Prasinococcus_capsulatus_cf.AAC.22